MLQSLHVKNLALMEETEVEFGNGLNILTGETGAGKSLLLGSVNLALGGKFEKEMLRKGAEYAFVELVFSADGEAVKEKLESMEIDAQDGTVIISRKIWPGKSVCRINGETVTVKQVKELSEYLIDIHGQHEHQSLLHKKKHKEILDEYARGDISKVKTEVETLYREFSDLKNKLELERMDEAAKNREQSLAEFELNEISQAKLIAGEDEELEKRYRLMINSKKITESLAESYGYTGGDGINGAGNSLSRALRIINGITSYDEKLSEFAEQLSEIESLLSDFNRDVAEYLTECEFDEEAFDVVESRLDLINRLKGKYGNTIEEILAYADKKQELSDKLNDYDAYMAKLESDMITAEKKLNAACGKLSDLRQKNAAALSSVLCEALVNLNFLSVKFEIEVRPMQTVTADGYDDVEFMISTNPGEPLMPLEKVSSGGELSRIMLAIKTVLAEKDFIDTLIFDEIDTGISGKTAWRVSEQLDTLAHAHQVICITHLPQIAAMADMHFAIEKSVKGDSTVTNIKEIENDESMAELARLLGSDELSDAALENASQMKKQAKEHKSNCILNKN